MCTRNNSILFVAQQVKRMEVTMGSENQTYRSTSPIVYAISNASRKSGVPEGTLRRLVGEGRLKSIKIGGRVYITWDSLRDLLENGEEV